MKRLLMTALVLIWATGTSLQAAQTTSRHAALPFWKPVGPWVILLLPLSNGSYACTAVTRSASAGPGSYSMAFVLSASATHFYLNDPALPITAAKSVTLAVDGHRIAELTVLLQQPYNHGEQLLMADIPGDMLARQLIPFMVKGRMLEVTADERHYAMPIEGFEFVSRELSECAAMALGIQPDASTRSSLSRH